MKRTRCDSEETIFTWSDDISGFPTPFDDPEHPDHLEYVYLKFAENIDLHMENCVCDHCIGYDPERPIESVGSIDDDDFGEDSSMELPDSEDSYRFSC